MTTMRYHTRSLVSIFYPFRNENSISVLIDHQQINHLTVGTRSVRRTDVTITSPHIGFGIQIIQRKGIRATISEERHQNDQ